MLQPGFQAGLKESKEKATRSLYRSCGGTGLLFAHLAMLRIQTDLKEQFPEYLQFCVPATADLQGLRPGRHVLLLCPKDSTLLTVKIR